VTPGVSGTDNLITSGALKAEAQCPAVRAVDQTSAAKLQPPAEAFAEVINCLALNGVDYCMLARTEEGAVQAATIVVRRQEASVLFRSLRKVKIPGYQLVRYCSDAYESYRWEWAAIGAQLYLLRLTAVFGIWSGAQLVSSAEQIISQRQAVREYRWASAADEYCFLLAKAPGTLISAEAQSRLRVLIGELGEQALVLAAKILGKVQAACLIGTLMEDRGATSLESKGALSWRALAHPYELARYLVGNTRLWFRRWRNPAGLFLVMLGPDGVGKTTTRRELVKFLQPVFDSHGVWHFRPRVIGRVGPRRPIGAPHSMPARNWLMSVLYLFTLVVDCWLGYLWAIRPLLVRSSLVVLDRYFYDLLVDAKRYRYGGPKHLPAVLGRFVPPRNVLFLILDADTEVIFSRKRELPFDELVRQRAAYRDWAKNDADSVCVRTDDRVERVVVEAAHGILAVMAARLRSEPNCR
jgi:thymidylate kinase